MKEIVPGIWTWSIFNTEKQLNFNGWYIQTGHDAVVIDPPTPPDSILKEIEQKGRPATVLLTNKHHTRASEIFRRDFDSAVWVHENDKKLMEIPVDRAYREGDQFPCGLKAISLKDGKTPGETAFFFSGKVPTMILGDAVIGKPAGSLSMLPPEKFKDSKKAKEGLKALLNYKFEALLLGDGEPILSGGYNKLKQFLSTGVA